MLKNQLSWMPCNEQNLIEMLRRGDAVVEAIHWAGFTAVGAAWEPAEDVLHRKQGLRVDARLGGASRAGEVGVPR